MTDVNNEIRNVLSVEMERQGISPMQLSALSGYHNANIYRLLRGNRPNSANKMLLETATRLLQPLGLKIVVEDEEAEWGLDMRLRRMPKKLFHGERIEAREFVEQDGFHPRVDLFESPDMVLKFVPKPCEVYEIRPGRLIRKHFEIEDHPYGLMYSYHAHIPAEFIVNKVTYR